MKNLECTDECPIKKTSELIEGKWTTLIIRDLLGGAKRYSELLRSLDPISPKVLATRLVFLEESGLIKKKIYPTVPVTTEYSLSEKGRGLEKILLAMAEFGSKL